MTTLTTRRAGAQITFRQDDRLLNRDGSPRDGRWVGTLLNPDAIDVWSGQRVGQPSTIARAYLCTITGPSILTPDAPQRYTLTTQGSHTSSRRHRTFHSLTEAQEAAIKWAARRFFVEYEVAA